MNSIDVIDLVDQIELKLSQVLAYKKVNGVFYVFTKHVKNCAQLSEVKFDCMGDIYLDSFDYYASIELAMKIAKADNFKLNFIEE